MKNHVHVVVIQKVNVYAINMVTGSTENVYYKKITFKTLEWDYNGWVNAGIPYTQKEWNQTLITRINQASANIFKANMFSGANLIKLSPSLIFILKDLEYLSIEDEGQYYLSGRYKIVFDDTLPKDIILVRNEVMMGKTQIEIKLLGLPSIPPVDSITGEINLPYLPNSEDSLPSDELDEVANLLYFFEMYKRTVEMGKPNIRAANNLRTIINLIQVKHDATLMDEIRTMTHDMSDEPKLFFTEPVENNKVQSMIDKFIIKLKQIIKNDGQ